MELQTKVPVTPGSPGIDHGSQVLVLGSCFAVHMGQKLDYYQFRTLQNPLGILYQPQAIYEVVRRAVEKEAFQEEDLFYYQERWNCWAAHSELSHPDKKVVLDRLNRNLSGLAKHLQSTTHLLLTLGTAWAYRHKGNGKLVANCHKVPQKEFKKELLAPAILAGYLERIRALIPSRVRMITTVSPVRHLRDGFTENQRSKAHLLTAVHQVRGLDYFPSYEIMMDELRDYRFYAEDMVHPNQLAIDYIWERFVSTWVSDKAHPVMQQVAEIRKGLAHRPFNPNSEAHKKFLAGLERKIKVLQQSYSYMKF